MTKTSIIPVGMEGLYRRFHFSPAIKAAGLLFVSGQIGLTPDRKVAEGIPAQIHFAFESIGQILQSAGLDFADVVDITSFHVGPMADHMVPLTEALAKIVGEPYPACTSVEVAGLAVPGALVEIKVTAITG